MSEYVTVRNFLDTEVRTEEYPKGKLYEKGEKFPAEGLKVSEERLRELSTYNNSAGDIFIKKVDENKETINPFKDEEIENEEEVTENEKPKEKKASTRGRRKKAD